MQGGMLYILEVKSIKYNDQSNFFKERLQYKLPVDGISCDNILIHIPNTIS